MTEDYEGMWGINRPLKAWDFELGDPSWRRWFDALKEAGVDEIGPSYGFRQGIAKNVQKPIFADPNDTNSKLLGRQSVPGYSTREYTVEDPFDLNPAVRGLNKAFKRRY